MTTALLIMPHFKNAGNIIILNFMQYVVFHRNYFYSDLVQFLTKVLSHKFAGFKLNFTIYKMKVNYYSL